MRFKPKLLFIISLIIALGLFLRLYRYEELFYYAIDEEKAAYITTGIAKLEHLPTAGYPSSIGFRQGPLFFYLTSFVYRFFDPLPVTVGYLSILASVVSMLLIYAVMKKINPKTGLIAVFFYAVSYLNVLYERRGWQLSLDSLLILTVLYSLLNLIKGKQKFIIPLFLSLAMMTNFEMALLNFLPWTLMAWLFFRINTHRKFIIIGISLIIAANASLLVFDLRHQFLNSRYLLNYFISDSSIRIAPNVPLTGQREVYLAHNLFPNTLARTLYPAAGHDLAIQYANCPQYLTFKYSRIPKILRLFVILLIFYYVYFLFKKRQIRDLNWQLVFLAVSFILLHFAATSVYTYIFQGEMAEYYLIPVFAFFFMLVALAFREMVNRKLSLPVYILMFLFSCANIIPLVQSENSYGLNKKLAAVDAGLRALGNSSFELSSFQTCWYSGGYRYLFTYKGKEPDRSYMDRYLSEYYTPEAGKNVDSELIILTPELIGENPAGYEAYRHEIITTSEHIGTFGAIEVYLIDSNDL